MGRSLGEAVYVYDDKGDFDLPAHGLTNSNQDGRLAYYEDEAGASFFEYDALGRVIAVVRHDGSIRTSWDPNHLVRVEYAYGAEGQLTMLTYPSGLQVEYVYGADKARPSAIYRSALGSSGFVPVMTDISYAHDGTPTDWLWVGDGSFRTQIIHDALGRVDSISMSAPSGADRTGVRYWYDADGDVLTEAAVESMNWISSSVGAASS